MDIGGTLRTMREERGLTQAEVGRRTGIARQYVLRIEHNNVRPGLRVLADICWHGLGCTFADFIASAVRPAVAA